MAMKRISPRQARRMMSQLGMRVEEVPNVQRVTISTANGDLIIDNPTVNILDMQGQKIYQITGEERTEVRETAVQEEDVLLVAQQAGASLDEARRALQETGGDLAQAIMLLSSKQK
jgi:nascent polypeptide-associated complex subunit alpha